MIFSSLPYQIQWVQQTISLGNLVPQCVSVKSRGALLCAFARDGLLLAVAVNQTDPKVGMNDSASFKLRVQFE